jgi:ubiquinone/menaquinone biosynthesis C-methylase UbiE
MSSDSPRYANYLPNFFETDDPKRARELILTKNFTMSSDERWEKETPYLLDKIDKALPISSEHLVLDYGCGIGRLAKAIIEKYRCRVLGIDISSSMRTMAESYVGSSLFRAIHPTQLDVELSSGLAVDHAYAVWVLQHTADPRQELRRLQHVVKPGGSLYIVNTAGRCVPCDLGWVNDGIDIYELMPTFSFQETHKEKMDLYPDENDPGKAHWLVTYQRVP